MDEREFLSRIDCRFPYTDAVEAHRLIARACELSPNVAFVVAYELAFPGHGVLAPSDVRLRFLDTLSLQLDHPLNEEILPIARKAILGIELTVESSIQAMREVARYPGQLAALAIACEACNDTAGDAETAYHQIRKSWGI